MQNRAEPGDMADRAVEAGELKSPLRIAPLSLDDAPAVYRLYEAAGTITPHGFLTERSEDEFRNVLGADETSASVGAWSGDRLVGYSLCSLETSRIHPSTPLIRHLQDRGEPLWSGKGTVVDPQFQGQLLLSRLLKRRGEIIAAKAVPHTVGLIATSNLLSLGGSLRAGAWVVGIERDSYCENFVCYGGDLQRECPVSGGVEIVTDDLAAIAARLAAGWVGLAMSRDRATASATLRLSQPHPALAALLRDEAA